MSDENKTVEPLLSSIIERVPAPRIDENIMNFKMLVTQTESSQYFGRLLVGKIQSGNIKLSDKIQAVDQEGKVKQVSQISRIYKKFGVNEAEIDEAYAGDIVSIAGLGTATVGATLNSLG